jgi:integrase/recombinase XerD
MINDIYPFAYHRYLALPVFAPVIDEFDDWLIKQGYKRYSRIIYINEARRIDAYFNLELNRSSLAEVTLDDFHTCWLFFHSRHIRITRTILNIKMFLQWKEVLPPDPEIIHQFSKYLNPYKDYLIEVRGLTNKTINDHIATVTQFLEHLECGVNVQFFKDLTASDVEVFVCHTGKKLKRESLQHVIAHLRSFLRYTSHTWGAPCGLDIQIDTPRVYRLEQIPCALSWKTVCALLESIDQKTLIGQRDYTIFHLMATYGLRCSDIVALTLDDIHWHRNEISISQRKTGEILLLPLTDAVGSVLQHYLQHGRPDSAYRQLFLRTRAPEGPLHSKAVTRRFHAWVERSKLDIPSHGAHCLRHSYAVHLLNLGHSVKVIGDLLGHQTVESTCVYLRIALEDLREVALSMPQACSEQPAQEVLS